MKKNLTAGPSPFRRGEKVAEKRILNRARKKCALETSDPHLRSSPLQGEGKTGQGEEGKPGRVPIDPIPYNTWKIKRLPPDLKEELDRMLTEGTLHSCRQLAKWLGDNGFEISHAAIHKYGQKFETPARCGPNGDRAGANRVRTIQRR